MSLLFIAPNRDMQPWKQAIIGEAPNIDVEIWPNIEQPDRVQFVACWNQPSHMLDHFPNLKAISSLGAGVDHILADESRPKDVSVCRVVAPSLESQMKNYLLNAVLNLQHNTYRYIRQQMQAQWTIHPRKEKADLSIGVMGLGKLGGPVTQMFANMGYTVNGWSKSAKQLPGIKTHTGPEGLQGFLANTNLLICLLPLTPQTHGILDLKLFKQLHHPAHLINVGRGAHLVEEDLIYAIDRGWMTGATLDVFTEEPLPEYHPFWNRKSIMITPHISSTSKPKEIAPQLVENYKRLLSGMKLQNAVDLQKGY